MLQKILFISFAEVKEISFLLYENERIFFILFVCTEKEIPVNINLRSNNTSAIYYSCVLCVTEQ